ncbi:hypothetical protein BDV96DRAFT_335863 [Lophiotrema nucula]|uniref:Uncharacterized protein n=1 Tax=Lophiotrema nucula TaxID=690887 RepID=A0A6A5YIX0_9PLEO|nr:hypothetical protein BDV96DRAFT_335863 [Lophiotrema nucula]
MSKKPLGDPDWRVANLQGLLFQPDDIASTVLVTCHRRTSERILATQQRLERLEGRRRRPSMHSFAVSSYSPPRWIGMTQTNRSCVVPSSNAIQMCRAFTAVWLRPIACHLQAVSSMDAIGFCGRSSPESGRDGRCVHLSPKYHLVPDGLTMVTLHHHLIAVSHGGALIPAPKREARESRRMV